MKTIAKQRWLGFATVDALLMLWAGSAMAASSSAATVAPEHLPALLLAGVGVVAFSARQRRRSA